VSGRVHAGKTVTIDVAAAELAIHCDDGVRTVRRTTGHPVTRIKAHRPRTSTTARQNDRMSSPYGTGRFAEVSGLDQVATHADVVTVVEQMLTDLRGHPDAWENHTLERFLDALAASLGAKKPPAQPPGSCSRRRWSWPAATSRPAAPGIRRD
jgi:hypothetical protein